MKKVFFWIGIILFSPVLLFLILSVLLYWKPVQNWAVDQATQVASEDTGLQVSIDEIDLDFPLDLGIDGIRVYSLQGDTIASIQRVEADVKLWPLLSQQVVVKKLAIDGTRLNTLDLIADLQVKGTVGHLSTHSEGIDLKNGTVALNNTRLADADLTILLSDTAATDTTTSVTPWAIAIDSVSIVHSRIDLHLPGDSMHITAAMGEASVHEGNINLLDGIYTVHSFRLAEGQMSYDLPYELPVTEGIDYNHIALSNINLMLDSICYSAPNLTLKVSEAALKEQSGLELTQLQGSLKMDSAGIRLPSLTLKTSHSNIFTRAAVDFNVMDSIQPGQMDVDLKAEIGKHDLLLFMGAMPQAFKTRWPDWPLTVDARMSGNMEQAEIDHIDISLPTAFHLYANGQTAQLNDPKSLMAEIDLEAETYDMGFATTMMDKELAQRIRIPGGLRLKGYIEARNGRYETFVNAREAQGTLVVKGWYNERLASYDAYADIRDIDLHHFLPKDSLFNLSATLTAKGQGTDFFKKTAWMEAEAEVEHLRYGQYDADSLVLKAQLRDGHARASLTGRNQLLHGNINVDALIDSDDLAATIETDLQRVDLKALQLVEKPLAIGLCGHIDVESNLKEKHDLTGMIGDLYISDSTQTYRPQDVGLRLHTNADTTLLRLQSGNFVLKADASGGYERLIDQCMALADTVILMNSKRRIDQPAIKRNLPTARLYLTSGRDNPIANFLRTSANIDFKDVAADLTSSPGSGINGDAHIFSLNADSTRIDTIKLHLHDTDNGLTYQGVVCNNRRNPQFVFRALLDGKLLEHGLVAGVRFYDDCDQLGLRLGMTADMIDDGLRFRLMPERPTIGYKEFNLNKDNYLLLHDNLRLEGKVDLIADDGTGVKIYSEQQDTTLLQDLTVSLYRFDLEKLTSVVPYMPRISGMLNGDYHLIMDQQQQISVASDMSVGNLIYEQSPIGNLSTEFVYLQREDGTHAVDGRLMLEGREIGNVKGEYKHEGAGYLDADMTFKRLPLMIGNGFIPDQIIGFEGFADGTVKIVGALNRPKVDGEIELDSAFLISKPYGVRLRFDNDPVSIQASKLKLENFTMYSYNDNPLNVMGDIDFSDLDRISMSLRMRAQNFQLINAKQTKESIAYGKAFVNFFAGMSGRLDQLRMRGRLEVLGTTDLTYILLDSPLSTNNQMDELVKFTDFTDSTQTTVQKPTPQGLDVDMNISIDQGAHVLCALNIDQTNYVDLLGGGDLRMKYTNEGITMTGRYTVGSGEMKYSLPVIPLKTFTIQDGSYVEFTGDPMNPRLNLTATERTKAVVGKEGEQSRSVVFDCGVVITKTLMDMGLEFIIRAPEDMSIANDLNAMSTEERGKLAVTMLTTGMYLADGNTSGFSMNSALSSFLQSEINNITGNALKTLDLSVGLDNTTDASGNMHTDYSFKFAKRFWNNRLRVQIGGKVSTGTEMQGQNQSFFDNVTMEYRLSPTSNQYVKLFYNQNVYDWLEGYTGQYGGGYMWKKKMDTLWEIFKPNQRPATNLRPTSQRSATPGNTTQGSTTQGPTSQGPTPNPSRGEGSLNRTADSKASNDSIQKK